MCNERTEDKKKEKKRKENGRIADDIDCAVIDWYRLDNFVKCCNF